MILDERDAEAIVNEFNFHGITKSFIEMFPDRLLFYILIDVEWESIDRWENIWTLWKSSNRFIESDYKVELTLDFAPYPPSSYDLPYITNNLKYKLKNRSDTEPVSKDIMIKNHNIIFTPIDYKESGYDWICWDSIFNHWSIKDRSEPKNRVFKILYYIKEKIMRKFRKPKYIYCP